MSSSVGDFYAPDPGQAREQRYSVPLDGKRMSIGPFPFRARSIVLVNQTAANLIAQDDRGEQYLAAEAIGATYGTGDSIRYEVWLDAAQSSGKATVVVSDQPAGITAAQLSSFAALGTALKGVTGRVACTAAGALIQGGSGFTVVRNGVGDMTVTFTQAFAADPIVVASIVAAVGVLDVGAPSGATRTQVRFQAFDVNGVAFESVTVYFIAVETI